MKAFVVVTIKDTETSKTHYAGFSVVASGYKGIDRKVIRIADSLEVNDTYIDTRYLMDDFKSDYFPRITLNNKGVIKGAPCLMNKKIVDIENYNSVKFFLGI